VARDDEGIHPELFDTQYVLAASNGPYEKLMVPHAGKRYASAFGRAGRLKAS
jgi:hypothetical protein